MSGADVAALRAAAPDLVLLVGGTDGGNADVLLHNAERIARARLAAPRRGRGQRRRGRRGGCPPGVDGSAARRHRQRAAPDRGGRTRGGAGRHPRGLPRPRHRRQGPLPRSRVRRDGAGPHPGCRARAGSRCSPQRRGRRRAGRRRGRGDDRRLLRASPRRARTRRSTARSSVRSGTRARSRPTSACGGTPKASSRPASASGSPVSDNMIRYAALPSRPTRVTSPRPPPSGWREEEIASTAAVVAVRRHGRPPHPSERPRPLADVACVVGSGGVLRHAPGDGGDRVLARSPATTAGAGGCPTRRSGGSDAAYVLFAVGLLAPDHPEAAAALAAPLAAPSDGTR